MASSADAAASSFEGVPSASGRYTCAQAPGVPLWYSIKLVVTHGCRLCRLAWHVRREDVIKTRELEP